VAESERLRLFCALRLPGETIERLGRWQESELRGGRIVPRENLHLTLTFLGSRPAGEVAAIGEALRAATAGANDLRFRVRGYRETRSVGMLTLDDEGGRAAEVAERLQGALGELGVYRREARPWLAHVTVLRFRERPRLDPALPALGEISPSDAAVYSSVLRSGSAEGGGAQYEVLETIEFFAG
jgi:RNA 2',3'-cyclic 3'-phosphodiesterase